jgi:DNA-binding transcriptional LysR family regulator
MNEQFHHFLLIVEHGTFTEAARHAHLAQPSLSASIQRLEDRVGARLLHRRPRGAGPTAAGKALIPHARAALASVESGLRAVAEVEGLGAGEVRLGGGATACTYVLPPVLAAFRARYPGLRIRLREIMTPQVREQTLHGDLDLGIGMGPDGEMWRLDELVVVSSPDRATAVVAGSPFVAFPRGAATRRSLDRHFPEVEVVVELASIASVKGFARAGYGFALLSKEAIRDDVALGTLVEVPDARTPISRQMVLHHKGEDRLSPAGRALRSFLMGVA